MSSIRARCNRFRRRFVEIIGPIEWDDRPDRDTRRRAEMRSFIEFLLSLLLIAALGVCCVCIRPVAEFATSRELSDFLTSRGFSLQHGHAAPGAARQLHLLGSRSRRRGRSTTCRAVRIAGSRRSGKASFERSTRSIPRSAASSRRRSAAAADHGKSAPRRRRRADRARLQAVREDTRKDPVNALWGGGGGGVVSPRGRRRRQPTCRRPGLPLRRSSSMQGEES